MSAASFETSVPVIPIATDVGLTQGWCVIHAITSLADTALALQRAIGLVLGGPMRKRSPAHARSRSDSDMVNSFPVGTRSFSDAEIGGDSGNSQR
jgi:hypothetical protein